MDNQDIMDNQDVMNIQDIMLNSDVMDNQDIMDNPNIMLNSNDIDNEYNKQLNWINNLTELKIFIDLNKRRPSQKKRQKKYCVNGWVIN